MERTRANLPLLALLVVLALSSAGCEVVEGIFKAGLWVGVILVVLVLGVIFWIVGKLRR
ncbi:MAG TPA: hypothetical protein VM364_07390 [Vicinamibacterales bacterium]|nr:hypothetical protein [Vicinamibacterales bacterium]